MLIFPSVIFSLLGVLFFRLWYFQVVQAEALMEKADTFNHTSVTQLAPRGLIYDRKGVMLAGVNPELVVTAIPVEIKAHPEVLDRVAAILQADRADLQKKVDDGIWKPYLPTTIYVGAPIQAATKIAELSSELPGIAVQSQPMRWYPDAKSFSHMLGYVWVPGPEDVERIEKLGVKPAQYVGKNGVELAFEPQLMGVPGLERLEVDAKRRPTKVVGRDAPVPGDQLILNIDNDIQQLAVQLLAGKKGAVAAIDPKDGGVLCLVSSPVYSLDLFKRGPKAKDYRGLMEDPAKPLFNRSVQTAEAPGSTFKIITTIAAMQAGKFDPNRPAFCAGGYRVGRRFVRCLGRHGSITFNRAMAKSCNAYFMDLGFRAGPDALQKACLDVGLYAQTGVEIGGWKGVVPTDEYLEKTKNPPMTGGHIANFSIGQGYLRVTPIQMANMMALVANDGVGYKARLVRAFRPATEDGKVVNINPEPSHKIDAPPGFWSTMKQGLVSVFEEGTARGSRIEGIAIGGKTGSAEKKGQNLTHSWFVGFAPAENPRIAICVYVEGAGHGGEVAAPIATKVIQAYLKPKSSNPAANAASNPAASSAPDASRAAR